MAEVNIMAVILFLLSIGLQLAAAIYALLLIRITGRRLAWILISIALFLMASRRIASFISILTTGKKIILDIPEFIALIISCLMLLGVMLIREYFRTITLAEAERKLADMAQRESKERLKTILDSMQVGVIIINEESHRIVDINPVATEIVGLPRDKIIGQVCHKFICPVDAGRCPITDLGQKIDNSERKLLKCDGEIVPILKTVIPITLDGQRNLLESFLDITERKKIESQLIHAQKMETVGTLAGGVAHDFNNILTAIIGYGSILQMEMREDDPSRHNVEHILASAERAANLTRGL